MTASARTEAELRMQVQALGRDAEAKDSRIAELEAKLTDRTGKADELEQQLT